MRAALSSISILCLMACSDASIKAVNTAPDATITSHMDGDVVAADENFTVLGVVSDVDDPLSSLNTSWLWGETTLCAPTSPEEEGMSRCTLSLPAGEAVITLLVRDPRGATGSAQIKIISSPPLGDDTGSPPQDTGEPEDTGDPLINEAPSCLITAPIEGAEVTSGTPVLMSGSVADVEDPPEALSVSWASDLDGTLSTTGADTSGAVGLSTDTLSVGTHVIILTATDTDGASCSDTTSISINGPPTAPEVVIEPGPAFTGDDLTAVVVASSTDPEGDAVSYTFAWSVDGTPVAATGSTIPATDTERGQMWTVQVTPSDALAAGPAGEASREISNIPPEVDSVSLGPVPAYTNDTINTTASASDSEGDPVSLSYTWTVNSVAVSETGSSLDGTVHFSKGDEVGLTITPEDLLDAGSPVSATPIVIDNTPPTAPTLTIEPEDPVEGRDALECIMLSLPTDADGDPVSTIGTWTVDGVPASGAPGPADIHEGEVWTCTVTTNDGEDDGGSATASVTIGALPLLQSCLEILEAGYSTGDGEYEIDPPCGDTITVWCDMSTDGGGWTTITDLDFSSDACPDEWIEESGEDLCSRDSAYGLISSADFSNWCIPYSDLRGTLVGIQRGSTDGFGDFPPHDIDDTYGDAISFTVGDPGSRQHLFTYGFGFRTDTSDDSNCPHHPGGASPASFVGSDFLCDTGNITPGGPESRWYTDVPLFEGEWFQVAVAADTTDPIEGRLMCTGARSDEDVGVESIVLRIR